MIHQFSRDGRADRLMRWNILAIAASILLGLLVIPSRVQGKTIFDDDWVPPKSDTPVQPPAQTPPATQPVTPPESVNPKTSVNTPPPPPTVAVPVHRPIPAKADQARSRKLFKESYAADLANRSAAGRRALATKLLEQAGAVSDAPSDQFVLLVGATEAAKEASDLALVSRAADALADAYEVDGLHVKSDAATQMALRVDSPAATTENCRNGLELVDQLATAGDLATAQRLLKSLQAAMPDVEVRSQIQKRTKEIDALKTAADRITMFAQKLKTAPDDPMANLVVGQNLCFVKGDWLHGLPMLAKGSDASAKNLAAQELKNPSDAEGQLAVADGWWAHGDTQHDPEKAAIQLHARDYYRKVLPGLKGLAKLKAETRLAGVPPAVARDTARKPAAMIKFEFNAAQGLDPFDITGNVKVNSDGELELSNGTPSVAKIKEVFKGPMRAEIEVYCREDGVLDINPHILAGTDGKGLHFSFGDSFNRISWVSLYGKKTRVAIDPIRANQVYKVVLSIDEERKAKVELDGKVIFTGTVPDDVPMEGQVILSGGRGHVVYKRCVVTGAQTGTVPIKSRSPDGSLALIDEARAVIRAVPPEFDPESVAEWTEATQNAVNQALLQKLGGKQAEFSFVMKWVSVKHRVADSQPIMVGKISFRLALDFDDVEMKRFAAVHPGTACTAGGEFLRPRFEGTELIVEMQHCKVVSSN